MKELTAMPQLIPQEEFNVAYAEKWRKLALAAQKRGSAIKHLLKAAEGVREYPIYHYRKSNTSGVWFLYDGTAVTYVYAYTSINLKGKARACEALAYLFKTTGVRGVTKEIFFDFLLPDQKFVVTDSVYTPDGKRWFEAEYTYAFRAGHKVYALDLTKKQVELTQIDEDTFWELQSLYWGEDSLHQKYRFAIEQV